MAISRKHFSYFFLGVVILVAIYAGWAVVSPFIIAGIVAYLLNPLVNFLNQKLKLPRTVSILLIYLVLLGLIAITVYNLSFQIAQESKELVYNATLQISALPGWIQPAALDFMESLKNTLTPLNKKVITYLPGALNRTVSFLVFLVATFYFLKDGHSFQHNLLKIFPGKLKEEIEEILFKINKVLGNYLRGQLLVILIMSVTVYLGLVLIGVRYALVLSLLTGFLGIIPFVGITTATLVTVFVAFTDQFSRLGMDPVIEILAIVSLFVVLNQLNDLFISPHIMGKVTKIHPLVIMFCVLAGGHLFGIVGYIIAVPVVASIKVVLDHLFEIQQKAPESE